MFSAQIIGKSLDVKKCELTCGRFTGRLQKRYAATALGKDNETTCAKYLQEDGNCQILALFITKVVTHMKKRGLGVENPILNGLDIISFVMFPRRVSCVTGRVQTWLHKRAFERFNVLGQLS